MCNKEWFRQELTRGVILLHDNTRPQTANAITALSQKFKWEVLGHPPYSPDLSPCDDTTCGPLKKGSEEQKNHLGRRCQAVRAELVHRAAPEILRDSHSSPCVEEGQMSQQPGPYF